MSGILPGLLQAKDLTQAELAKRTGIAREDINAYCNGRKRLGAKNGRKVALTLGLPERFFEEAPTSVPPEMERLQQRAEELLREVADLRQRFQEGSA